MCSAGGKNVLVLPEEEKVLEKILPNIEFSSPKTAKSLNQFRGIVSDESGGIDYRHSSRQTNSGSEKHSHRNNKKKLRSSIVLPKRFLLGGNLADPLNLQGLIGSTDGGSECVAVSSLRRRDQILDVVMPKNLTDPLNLNVNCTRSSLSVGERIDCVADARLNDAGVDQSLLHKTAPSLQTNGKHSGEESTSENRVDHVFDKLVSPAVRQFTQKRKKHGGSSHKKLILTDINATKVTAKEGCSKPSAKKYCSGNYPAYYGYRNCAKSDDRRLQFFTPELFQSRDVLDIGCNAGNVTLTVARDFYPRQIVGLDVDPRLIESAKRNVRNFIGKNKSYPNSMKALYGPVSAGAPISAADAVVQSNAFPLNVLFQVNDYVLGSEDELKLQREEYDVILALSVTKWIHLNHGDEGLRRSFRRIIRQLRPGGKLILEAQPWSSYKRRKKLTDKIFETYQSITFFPDQFNDYLLSSDVGFESCELLGTPSHESKGFQRSVYVFTKPSTTNANTS